MASHANSTAAPDRRTFVSKSRRRFLRATATAIATASLATAVDTAPAAQASADAELIALCHAFDNLERQMRATLETFAEERQDEADKAIEPMHDRQGELLERICALRAQTAAGIAAVARTLALYAPDWARSPEEPYVDLRLRAVLLSSALVGVA